MRNCFIFLVLMGVWFQATADQLPESTVIHFDALHWDNTLTLPQTVALTLERFPRQAIIRARQRESEALTRRGDFLLAGVPRISGRFGSDAPIDDTGYYEIETGLALPLWNWGQRDAGQALGREAEVAVKAYAEALKLQVAGLVREALWRLKLEQTRFELAQQRLALADRLVETVRRRVELGDLPRADLLLAQSNRLAKVSGVTEAEAEWMHARKGYHTLTQSDHAPELIEEEPSGQPSIPETHPLMLASGARINRLNAELHWVRSAGSGQSTVTVGSKHERDFRNEPTIDSLNVTVSVPFGGGAAKAPKVAKANLELTEALAEHNMLQRKLEQALHEADHALVVDRAEAVTERARKNLAEEHLHMSEIGFSNGEITLIELIKIQSVAYDAIGADQLRSFIFGRDIARYNQSVGELPQ